LSNGAIDIAFSIGSRIKTKYTIEVLELQERIQVLAHPDHPLTRKKKKLVPLDFDTSDFRIVSQLLYHKDKWISPALSEFIRISGQKLG